MLPRQGTQVIGIARVFAIGVDRAWRPADRAGEGATDVVDALVVVRTGDPGNATRPVGLAEIRDRRIDGAVEIVVEDQDVRAALVFRLRVRPAQHQRRVAIVHTGTRKRGAGVTGQAADLIFLAHVLERGNANGVVARHVDGGARTGLLAPDDDLADQIVARDRALPALVDRDALELADERILWRNRHRPFVRLTVETDAAAWVAIERKAWRQHAMPARALRIDRTARRSVVGA